MKPQSHQADGSCVGCLYDYITGKDTGFVLANELATMFYFTACGPIAPSELLPLKVFISSDGPLALGARIQTSCHFDITGLGNAR